MATTSTGVKIGRAKPGGTIRIQPTKGLTAWNLRELWDYRDLVLLLARRDIRVRYTHTILGPLWAILQPIIAMIIYSLIFGNLARLPSEGKEYPIFVYAALLPWDFFAGGLGQAANSVITNRGLVTKVYLPRLAIPLVGILPQVVDFLLAFLVLLVLMAIFHVPLTLTVIWLPVFLFLAFLSALGMGLWFSAMTVRFRDVRFVITYLLQFWFYATPIAYSSTLLPSPLNVLYALNPMSAVVEGFRWALLGSEVTPGLHTVLSVAVALLILLTGMLYYNRQQRTFADLI